MSALKLAFGIAACLCLAAPFVPAQIFGREEIPSNIVQFDLVAYDAHGQPVGNLTADDLQITDAGKPEKIALFRHSEGKLQQSAPLQPGELTNRISTNVPRATLVLFDLLNEGMGSRGTALNNLVHALQSLESTDYLYIYLLTQDGALYPVHPLPGPSGEAPSGENGVPWTKNSKPLLDQAINKVYRLRPVELDIDTRVRMTYRALDGVAAMLAGIPGRKNVVWITHGIPITIGPEATYTGTAIDYTPMLESMSLRFDRCNVAIYPIQQTPPGMAMSPDAHSGLGSEDTLQSFADLTGGPNRSTGEILQIVRQAMQDARSSYLVGYYPPTANWDGKFHKLKITCRVKGVRLQAKTGYYAVLDQLNEDQVAFDTQIAASYDATEIEIRGKVSSSPAGPDEVHLLFRIDPALVRFTDENGHSVAHLVVELATYSADGKVQGTGPAPLDLSYTPAEKAKLAETWIQVQHDLKVTGLDKLRLMVYDKGSHSIGSLTVAVKDGAR